MMESLILQRLSATKSFKFSLKLDLIVSSWSLKFLQFLSNNKPKII